MMSYAGSVTALSALDLVVWQRSEIVLLGIFAASEEVAYYSIAFAVADAVQQAVPQAIQTALFPTQSRAVETGDRVYLQQTYETSVRLLVLVTVPVAVAGSVLAAPLIVTVYGEAYAEAVLPLQVLLFSAGAGRVGYAFSSVLYAADRERLMLKLTGVWAVLNLGLGIVLVPALGLVGAVIANASVQVLAVAVAPFVVRRTMGLRFPFADVLRVLVAGVPLALVLAAVVAVVDGDLLALGVGGLLALPAYVAGLALTRAVPPAERAVLREQVQRLTGRPSG
jgi:O-antigen/teichoic acid export membrane protein